METDLDREGVEHRCEHRAATQLVLALGGFPVRDLLAVQLESRKLLRGAGEDHRAAAVADGQHRRRHGAHVPAECLEQIGDAVRVGIGHRDHRAAVAEGHDAAAAGHQRSGGTDELSKGQQLDIAGAGGLERLDGQNSLRMAGHRDRPGGVELQTLPGQRTDRRDLGQQNTGHRHRRRGQVGRHRLAGGEGPRPAQRGEPDRTDDDQFVCDRPQQPLGFADQTPQFGLDAGGGDDLFQSAQPGAVALTSEHHGVGLSGVESIHKRVGGCPVPRFRFGGQPVVLVNRHCASPSHRYCALRVA